MCVCARVFEGRVPFALLVLVSLHVQGQVVRSGEGARADGALEGFGARVLPVVARQLVGAGEAPVAAVPRAPVRLLTSVSPEVSFQMGRLGVYFLAAWVVTVVDAPLLQVGVVPAVVADRHCGGGRGLPLGGGGGGALGERRGGTARRVGEG